MGACRLGAGARSALDAGEALRCGVTRRPPSSRRVKPSSTCGPFRTLDTMYEAGKVWVRRLEKAGPRVSWLPWVHRYLVENTFPVYLVSALLL